jgi:hypothetical protein
MKFDGGACDAADARHTTAAAHDSHGNGPRPACVGCASTGFCEAGDPQAKGIVERLQDFLERWR